MSKKRYSMWDAEEKDTKRQQREAKLEQSMRDEQLKSSQAWMLNGKYTDVSISCKSKEFRAHRIVLSRCRFFESCFEHGFKETESRLITLDDDDPDALEAVLTFLYTMSASFLDDKEETCWTNTKNVSELMQYLVNVAILADKYSLPMLLEAVKVRLEDDDQSSNRRNLSRWSVGLLGAIALIPRHTESADLSDLRKALNQEDLAKQAKCKGALDKADLLIQEHPEIATDVFGAWSERYAELKREHDKGMKLLRSEAPHYFDHEGRLKEDSF